MLWGVSAYFSAGSAARPPANLTLFSAAVRRQGLPLLLVELAFGDHPFVFPEGLAERVLRVRADALMWQKERLLNLGIAALPDACDQVVWLDTDILFENDHWVAETSARLGRHALVQPFERVCWLGPGQRWAPPAAPLGLGEGHWLPGMAAAMAASATPARDLLDYLRHGHTGFAWAARRDLIGRHGLYDRAIVGGGDVVMAHAFYDDRDFRRGRNPYSNKLGAAERDYMARWSTALAAARDGPPAAVGGRVLHLDHGPLSGRGYGERLRILKDARFDPETDLALIAGGCWGWGSDKPGLHRAVADYLRGRGGEVAAGPAAAPRSAARPPGATA